MPFGLPDYHRSLLHLHVGCEEPRAYFVPHSDPATAAEGVRDYSDRFKTLCGEWDFAFAPAVELLPDPRGDVAFTDKMTVPMNWQNVLGKGYDTPNYTNIRYPYPKDPPHVPVDIPSALYSRSVTVSPKAGTEYTPQ